MNSFKPLVSAIVPVYNGESFVDSCLDAIARQQYQPIEIVVVNDGSTDGSLAHIRKHSSRPVVVNIPHSGLAAARNAGIRQARGELIAFCDIDDLWLPEKIARQVERFAADPAVGLVCTGLATFGREGDRPKKRKPSALEKRFNTGDQFELLAQKSIIAPSSAMVRRSVFDRVGMFEESLFSCEDWDLWLRIAQAGIPMFRIPGSLTLYRRHGTNMSKKIDTMHRCRMQVLERAFAVQASTPDTARLKKRAYARAFLEAANGYYSAGDVVNFRRYFREAQKHGSVFSSPKAVRRFIKDSLFRSDGRRHD